MKQYLFVPGLFLLLFSCIGNKKDYLITDFGAKIENSNNQLAIQKAIDQCHSHGGGTVTVPPGSFVTGAIELKSNMTLNLEPGALLLASEKKEDYVVKGKQYAWLILAKNTEDVSISGSGSIIGTGKDITAIMKGVTYTFPKFRPGLIHFDSCKNVKIENIYIKNSDLFSISLNRCKDVKISGITLHNNYYHANSDGIDPSDCDDVIISGCNITSGDDCICLKNGGRRIIIENCILQTPSTGFKIGTTTGNVFENILINNCIIYNSMVGIGIYMKDGGLVQNLTCSNIQIEDIQDTTNANEGIKKQQLPIFVDIDLRNKDSKPGKVRDIFFSNIIINSYNKILIQGMKTDLVENLIIDNLVFNVTKASDFSEKMKPKGFADNKFYYHPDDRLTEYIRKESWITIANAKNIRLSDIIVNVPKEVNRLYPRDYLYLDNVQSGTIRYIKGYKENYLQSKNKIQTNNSTDIFITE